MSKGLNKVMLIGNLVADPEVKFAASGIAIANIRLATNENSKDKDGNWVEKAEFHRLVAFGKTAEALKDYTRKGSKIYVEGRIQTSSWDDKDGNKKYSTEVVVNNMIMLDSKPSGQGQGQSQGYAPPPQNAPNVPEGDDIPF